MNLRTKVIPLDMFEVAYALLMCLNLILRYIMNAYCKAVEIISSTRKANEV